MNLSSLDEGSRDLAGRLLSAYPQWWTFSKIERYADEDADHLAIKVQAPEPRDLASPLWVEIGVGGAVIGFDHTHGHYSWPPHQGRTGVWFDPLALIDAILQENVAAASEWHGGWLSASRWTERGQDPRQRPRYGADRIRVRSWTGTLDRDLVFESP